MPGHRMKRGKTKYLSMMRFILASVLITFSLVLAKSIDMYIHMLSSLVKVKVTLS